MTAASVPGSVAASFGWVPLGCIVVEAEHTEAVATVTEDTNTEVPDSSEIPAHLSTLDLARRAIRMTLISFVPAIAIIAVLFVRHRRRKRLLVEPEEESVPAQSGAENRVNQMLELMRQDESVLAATDSGEQSQELDSLDQAVASVLAGTGESTPAAEAARAPAAADDQDSIDDFDPESLIPESLLTSITELTPTAQSAAPTQLLTRFDAADSLHYGNARLRASSDTEQDDTTSFDPHGDSDDLQSDCDSILDRLWQTDRTPDLPESSSVFGSTNDDGDARSALATAQREAARSLETHGHVVEQPVEPEYESLDASAGFSMSDGGAATATLERTAVARLTVSPATDNSDFLSLSDVESPAFQELPPAECSIAPVLVPPLVPVQDTTSANTKAEETTPAAAATPSQATEPKHDDLITDYLTGLLNRSRDEKVQQSERRNSTPTTNPGPDRRNAAPAVPERKVVKSYIEEYLAKEAEKSAEKSGASLPNVADAIGLSSAIVIAAPRPERAPVNISAQRERMESFREMAIESVDHALRTHRVRMAYGSLASRKLMLAALVSMLLLFVLANTSQLIHFGSLNWIMVAIIVFAFSEWCLRLQDLQKQKHSMRSQRVIAGADPNARATDASELTPFEPADVSGSM